MRTTLEQLLDEICEGQVHLDRIADLSLGGVVVEGVTVRDGEGRTVLRAKRLALGLDPSALVHLELRFSHALLEDAMIRAIPSEHAGITLFDALSPPAPATPEPPSEGSALDVVFEHIHVTHAHLTGAVPGLDALEVLGLEARGTIGIVDGALSVRVSAAHGDITRPFAHALSLDHATFALDTGPVLRMFAKARASQRGDRLHAALTFRAPEHGEDHLDLLLGLDPLSPDLLVDFGIVPAQILLSSMRGHARLSGPLRALSFAAALDTDAGALTLRGKLPEPGGVSLVLESRALALSQLIGYAPPLSLDVRVALEAPPSGPVKLRLSAPHVSLFDVELTDADIEGLYDDERLTLSHARLQFGGGQFAISGWVDADANLSLRVRSRVPDVARDPSVRSTGLRGGLRTDVRIERDAQQLALVGSIGIERFGFSGIGAKEVVFEGEIRGSEALSDARVDVRGSSWGTTFYDRKIGDIDFHARGKSPRFDADFALIDGLARTASAHLALTMKGDAYHVLLSPLEVGVPGRDEPWRARADLTIDDEGVRLHQVYLAKGPERLDLTGQYAYSAAYRVDATLQSFDLGGLRELSGLDLADLDGTLDGKLALTGVPGHPRIDAQGTLQHGVFLGMTDLTVLLSLGSFERRFDLDAELILPDESRFAIYAGGEPGEGPTWLAQVSGGNYQFGLDFERVPFEVSRPWLAWLGSEPPPGKISATVRGAGTLRAPYLEVKSQIEGLKVGEWPKLDIALDVQHDGKRASLHELAVADEHGALARLEGFIEARADELLDPLALRASLGTRPLELALSWENRRLDELPKPMRIDAALPSWGALRITQTDSGPLLALTTRLGWPEGSEGIDACGARRHPNVELAVNAHDQRATAKLTARLDDEQLAMADIESDVPLVAWLSGSAPIDYPRTSVTLSGETQAAEEVPGLCELVAGPLHVDVSALDAFADPPELSVALRSQGLQLVAHESQRQRLGNLRDVRTTGRPFAVVASGGVEGASFVFQAAIDEQKDAHLRISGSLPRAAVRRSEPPTPAWPAAELHIDAHELDLAPLLLALPLSIQGSGLLEGVADATYDFARDEVTLYGGLALSHGRIVIGGLGQELSDVRARLVLHDRTVALEDLSVRDFDGRMTAKGQLIFDGLTALRSELALTLTDFPVRRESAQVSRLTGAMRLRAETTPERTRAELTFGELRVSLPNDLGQGLQTLDEHPDIAVRGREAPEAPEDPHLLELRIVANDPPFRILRSDLSAEVAADLTVRHLAPSLTLSGAAEIKRGSFELYGKRFELGESRLAFDGGEEIDPLVSLGAVHRTGGDEIGVRVEGRLSDPKISFSHSNPAITETGDIVAQLLGARTVQSDGTVTQNRDASGAAAGILAGATAGLLTQEVRRNFGGALPVLSLESNSQTLRSARIRAGVQLDQLIERRLGALRRVVRGAYVEGFVAPGASEDAVGTTATPQSRGGGLLELRFPRDLVGTIEYRPVQNWRLDLAWEP